MHEICKRLARFGINVRAITSWFEGLKHTERIDGYYVQRIGTHENYILHVPRILRQYSDWAQVIVEDMSKVPLMTPLFRHQRTSVIAIVHHLNRDIYFQELPLHKAIIAYILESIMPKLYSLLPDVTLVAVSKSTREELGRLGANLRRIRIVPNGINEYELNDGNLTCKDPKPTIIFFSRVKKYKQPHHVLLAFRKILKQITDVKLVIAGKGTESLFKYLRRLKIDHATEIYGEVDDETKSRLLSRAWILVQTSRKEGFGITVLEAAICGTPTICYDVPGLRDAVKHMKTGILVNLNDINELAKAIILLLRNEALRDSLSRNAYHNARRFSWDKSARTFVKILEELQNGD